jgi:type II secretory pathway pseudopilin PulG
MTRRLSCSSNGEAGFSLLEVLIAAGLLVSVAAGVTQVSILTVRASYGARAQTLSTVLAAQKMEQLRSLTWTYTETGDPSSDNFTNLSTDPPSGSGPGLQPSPSGSLDTDTALYVDYLDAAGGWVPSRAGAVYVRRWAIRPLASDPNNIVILQVRVLTATGDESRLATLKARRSW